MDGIALPGLRAHRQAQAELDYPLLRACPTTEAIRLTLYLDGLAPADRLAYADQLSCLDEQLAAHPPASNAEIHERIRGLPLVAAFLAPRMGMAAPPRGPFDLRVTPVKVLARVLADEDSGGFEGFAKTVGLSDDPVARLPAPVVAGSLDDVVPVEPRRLRKLIDEAMARALGAKAERVDKEMVRYSAIRPEGSARVDIVFAAPGRLLHQFDYSVTPLRDGRPSAPPRSYEGAWRLASRWDGVTQGNAERSVAHLVTLVEACLAMA